MSKIIAIAHLETKNWEVNIADTGAFFTNLYIGFTDEAPVIQFKNLQFKYELRQGKNIQQYSIFPPPSVRYVQTDQAYLVVELLNNLKPDEAYNLYLWATNGGDFFESTIDFIVPRPFQPYDSWTWDGEQWTSPVPYPNDGNTYLWNENTHTWELSPTS